MKSMTGYGKNTVQLDGRTLTIEVKSVNHRFLDIVLKNFRQLAFSEEAVKKRIEDFNLRGHIEVYINYVDMRDSATEIKIDNSLVRAYKEAAELLSNEHGIIDDLSMSALMRVRDVFKETVAEDDESVLVGMIEECCIAALIDLDTAKKREGECLKVDLNTKLKNIKQIVEKITERAPEVAQEYAEKLRARITEALAGFEIDESKLANEIAFFVDKAGIDEEIQRLKIHLDALLELLDSTAAIGRKMDFIIQEVNREINTIGSKANDITTSNLVIAAKAELERVREQVQNIE